MVNIQPHSMQQQQDLARLIIANSLQQPGGWFLVKASVQVHDNYVVAESRL